MVTEAACSSPKPPGFSTETVTFRVTVFPAPTMSLPETAVTVPVKVSKEPSNSPSAV